MGQSGRLWSLPKLVTGDSPSQSYRAHPRGVAVFAGPHPQSMAGEPATLPIHSGLLERDAVTQHSIARCNSSPAASIRCRSGCVYPGCRRSDRGGRLCITSSRQDFEDGRGQTRDQRRQPQPIRFSISPTNCHIIDSRPGSRLARVPAISSLHSRVA